MGVRLFTAGANYSMPLTTVAAALTLQSGAGTVLRVTNPASTEVFIAIFNTPQTVIVPISTSTSTGGMSVLPGTSVAFEIGNSLAVSAMAAVATATPTIRLSQGEGHIT